MGVKKIKGQFKNIIIFLLVIVILFSFSIKPYADFVLLGLGLKVLATVLASMGILTFVNSQQGGISGFWNGLVEYCQKVKGITSVLEMFVNIGIRSMAENTKMKVSSLVSLVKEYYNSINWLEEPPNGYLDIEYGSVKTIKGIYKGIFTDFVISHTEDIGKGYSIKLNMYRNSTNTSYLHPEILFNGVRVVASSGIASNIKISNKIDDDIEFSYALSYYGESIMFRALVHNKTLNTTVELQKDYTVDFPIGLQDLPRVQPAEMEDVPIPQTVPLGLAMPWELALVNQTEAIGLTLSQLYELVSSISLTSFVEKISEIPKAIVDSLPQSEIITDSEGVITDVTVYDIPDGLPDIKEQTGLLGGILAFLLNLFKFPDKIDLNLDPLQNLVLIDRFPFSLPWDLKNSFSVLVAPPVPPRFEIPFITENIIIDLGEFEVWAKISRTFSSILFVGGLILSTRKFIGGA